MQDLRRRGVTSAYLYGDTPIETYSALNSFYLLVDSPSVYGLPDHPVNPWRHMKGDYLRAIASGLAAIAGLNVPRATSARTVHRLGGPTLPIHSLRDGPAAI